MPDKLTIENEKVVLTTDEGKTFELGTERLLEMIRAETQAPIDQAALPDGVKFLEWRPPLLCVVHQLPAHVKLLRWITDDSPVPYGPGTKFQMRRLSIPYAVTFALYFQRGSGLGLMGYNELYFKNEPLKGRGDRLCYPALLNVSRIAGPRRRRAWICTQHLRNDPKQDWTAQLGALLDHTWNGAFNRSSEHHEGASWYGESKGIHPDLHPVERWEQASAVNDAFALGVPWMPAPLSVGELMSAMLDECQQAQGIGTRTPAGKQAAGLVTRFLNFAQKVAAV
jgi:hypothetical protein